MHKLGEVLHVEITGVSVCCFFCSGAQASATPEAHALPVVERRIHGSAIEYVQGFSGQFNWIIWITAALKWDPTTTTQPPLTFLRANVAEVSCPRAQ